MTVRGPRTAAQATRKPSVTMSALVAAALEVVEREGLDALSMRRLAEQLGVQAASLYWHVQSKEQVLDLLADELLALVLTEALPADLDRVGTGEVPWNEALRRTAVNYRAFLLRRRDAARIIAGRFIGGVLLARVLEPMLGVLRAGGLTARDAAYAVYAVIVYVQGFVLHESSPLSALDAEGMERSDALRGVKAAIEALPAEEFPYLAESADALTEANLDERFQFGLDRLIDGLRAYPG
jgi:TetR/AcrR family tetracycline transcriptional repressor